MLPRQFKQILRQPTLIVIHWQTRAVPSLACLPVANANLSLAQRYRPQGITIRISSKWITITSLKTTSSTFLQTAWLRRTSKTESLEEMITPSDQTVELIQLMPHLTLTLLKPCQSQYKESQPKESSLLSLFITRVQWTSATCRLFRHSSHLVHNKQAEPRSAHLSSTLRHQRLQIKRSSSNKRNSRTKTLHLECHSGHILTRRTRTNHDRLRKYSIHRHHILNGLLWNPKPQVEAQHHSSRIRIRHKVARQRRRRWPTSPFIRTLLHPPQTPSSKGLLVCLTRRTKAATAQIWRTRTQTRLQVRR